MTVRSLAVAAALGVGMAAWLHFDRPGGKPVLAPLWQPGSAMPLEDRNSAHLVETLTLGRPEALLGAWSNANGDLMAGYTDDASADDITALRGAAGAGAQLVRVKYSLAELREILDRLPGSAAGVVITGSALDIRADRVTVGLEQMTDAAREALAQQFGDAVNVRTQRGATVAQRSVSGTLRMTGGPAGTPQPGVAGTVVFTLGNQRRVVETAADGAFQTALPPGTYTVTGNSSLYRDGNGECRADAPVVVDDAAMGGIVVACVRR